MNHCGPDTVPPRPRMHHQLRHAEAIVLSPRKIQVADDVFAAAGGIAIGSKQVLSALMRQLPQNLLANGLHPIEFSSDTDEFTYLPLLIRTQRRPPLG
jgi:hypothetical protein